MNSEPPSYDALAFHRDQPGDGVPGRIVFTQFTLKFESASVSLEFPCNQLTLALAGGGEDGVIFRSAARPEWTLRAADDAILEHRIFTASNNLRLQLGAIHGRKAWRGALIATMLFFAAALIIGLGASWGMDKLVRFSVNRISPAYAKSIGDQEYNRLKGLVTISDDPKAVARFNAIYARLRVGMPDTNLTVEFHVIELDQPNASSLPGHVFVTRGLLDLLDTPEELAGVLAHELGHINQKHVFRRFISSQGPGYVLGAAFGDSKGALPALARGSQLMLGRSFSRQYEREADDEGWKYLVAARINPRGLIDALEKLRDSEHGRAPPSELLSTHPPTEERIHRLEDHWDHLKDKSGFIDLAQALRE